jgi:hypothetical protein
LPAGGIFDLARYGEASQREMAAGGERGAPRLRTLRALGRLDRNL